MVGIHVHLIQAPPPQEPKYVANVHHDEDDFRYVALALDTFPVFHLVCHSQGSFNIVSVELGAPFPAFRYCIKIRTREWAVNEALLQARGYVTNQ